MSEEEKIVQALIEKFTLTPELAVVKRPRRINVTVDPAIFRSVLDYLINQQGLNGLSTITGMDAGENFEIIYHLSKNGRRKQINGRSMLLPKKSM